MVSAQASLRNAFIDVLSSDFFTSAPWPIRLYVIENGVIQFISAPTDCTHDVSELRAWLEKRHAK